MITINKEFLDKHTYNSAFEHDYNCNKDSVSDLILKQIKRNSMYKIKSINAIGSIKSSDSLAVAVVGSRKMTSYGEKVITRIVKDLVSHNITIVSGLMYGVDIKAHKTAIENGGRTIGVLGYGLDYILRNKVVKQLCCDIIEKNCGAIISEYHRSMPGSNWSFPRRNNIIVALSKATIVIEAGESSGTSITANYTIKQNKQLFAVPGSIFSSESIGTNRLIKDGALLFDSIKDVLSHLNLDSSKLSKYKKMFVFKNLTDLDIDVLKTLNENEMSFDKIADITRLSCDKLNRVLTKLELSGILSRSISGNWYIL